MTLTEAIATLFGLACVWLTVKQHIGCWPTGLVQVILYIYIFYQARLYSDMILQIIYVPISIYGWYHWKQHMEDKSTVGTLPVSLRTFWTALTVMGSVGLGFVMATYTNASFPYPDSFITITSLVAQWLMAKKKLESWVFWILVDLVAITIYLLKGLYFTTGLYAVFLILAIWGYFEWRNNKLKALSLSSLNYE